MNGELHEPQHQLPFDSNDGGKSIQRHVDQFLHIQTTVHGFGTHAVPVPANQNKEALRKVWAQSLWMRSSGHIQNPYNIRNQEASFQVVDVDADVDSGIDIA